MWLCVAEAQPSLGLLAQAQPRVSEHISDFSNGSSYSECELVKQGVVLSTLCVVWPCR